MAHYKTLKAWQSTAFVRPEDSQTTSNLHWLISCVGLAIAFRSILPRATRAMVRGIVDAFWIPPGARWQKSKRLSRWRRSWDTSHLLISVGSRPYRTKPVGHSMACYG